MLGAKLTKGFMLGRLRKVVVVVVVVVVAVAVVVVVVVD